MNKKEIFKIGIDARMYGAEQTGIGFYIKNLIENILKLDAKNQYVIFLREPYFRNLNFPKNVQKVKSEIHWYGFFEQLFLPFIFLRHNPDLLHVPHFNAPIFYQKKFIVTIHDLTPKFFQARKNSLNFFKKIGYNFVLNNALRRAKKIIAVSNFTKDDIVKNFKINPGRIEVVYEGLRSFERGAPVKSADYLEKNFCVKQPYIFYNGVWRGHKNIAGLVRAFSAVAGNISDLNLVLGGRHDDKDIFDNVNKIIKELNLSGRVFMPGFIDDKDLPIFYSKASAVIIPSFYEGFGLVGLEAMSFNVPVVSSNKASLPEIFVDAAIYFDPENIEDMIKAMEKVLKDSILRDDLIKKGKERIAQFSWEKMAQQTLDIYNAVLKE